MRSFLLKLATLRPVGFEKPGPGTWGTVATMPLAVFLAWCGPLWHMSFTLLFLPISIVAAQVYEEKKGSHDAKEIVVDEAVGLLIAMVWLPFTWQSALAAFVLFRFFDILKPFPISYLDRHVKGGLGVVIDDVAAGVATNLILQVVVMKTYWLGVQSIVVQSG